MDGSLVGGGGCRCGWTRATTVSGAVVVVCQFSKVAFHV